MELDSSHPRLAIWAFLVLSSMLSSMTTGARGQGTEATPYAVRPVDRPGTLRGHVVFRGPAPAPVRLRVVSDYACCDVAPKWSENYRVGENGGLANCVVHLLDVSSGIPIPPTTVTVDQLACVFTPHVVVAHCNRNLRLRNSDPVFHNVHGYLMRGWYSVFNIGMPTKGYEIEKPITTPGPIILKCDAGHKWMTSYIYAVENPYAALTGKNGRFQIDGIPGGHHRIKVWHETLGEADLKVEIPPSGTVEVKIEGRLDRKPRLAAVAGPTLVPTPTAASWLYPPSDVSVPSPVATASVPLPAGLPETAPPASPGLSVLPGPGSPDEGGEPPDPLRTIWLVTGVLAVVLSFLLVLYFTRRRDGKR